MVAKTLRRPAFLFWLVFLLALSACRPTTPTPAPPTPPALEATPTQSSPTGTPTAPEPTPTSAPLAARVNGEGITLEEYEAELARFAAAGGVTAADLPGEDKTRVLNNLVEELLLSQAAAENGFELDEAALQERIDRLSTQMGSPQALQDWMAAQGYTEESFRRSLARSAAAAWMRDRILSELPDTAEQVHARQILLLDEGTAAETLARLNNGIDFAAIAREYDPVTGGELGWFPRGYLPDSKLDEAVFSLDLGQYSEVIKTAAGFHILQVIGREPQRPLEPDARLALQFRALQSWLEERRLASEIEILVS
jgi:hypothetical protein